MHSRFRLIAGAAAALGCAWTVLAAEPGEVRVMATSLQSIRDAAGPIDALMRSGELKAKAIHEDTLLPDRRHQRLAQYYKGVPVWGAEVVRQLDASGAVHSIFGDYRTGLELDVAPGIDRSAAARALQAAGVLPAAGSAVTLTILPHDGRYDLAFAIAGRVPGDVRQYFVDARSGRILQDYSLVDRDGPVVGQGMGVLNDRQKLSVTSVGSGFVARDQLRPAAISTSDMKGDPNHVNAVLVGAVALRDSDLAFDADNNWSDGAVVDAHAFGGVVYDYYFKRHGRRSWNGSDGQLRSLVHPVRAEDLDDYVRSGQFGDVQDFYVNAFFCCSGSLLGLGGFMVYGEGLPGSNPFGAPQYRAFAASIDVVAHEMTHGMTAFTSGLSGRFVESGALNESFSDQMGVAVDFFFRPQQANYRIGEDIVAGGIRDMASPAIFGDADHVSVLRDENFEVHSLASLSNHAYYLAIEGGTNRVSGIRVQGVGPANRAQVERSFYRAYQFMLGPGSGYCSATAASILSAGELYGNNSPAQQAVIQAWTAVGLVDLCF